MNPMINLNCWFPFYQFEFQKRYKVTQMDKKDMPLFGKNNSYFESIVSPRQLYIVAIYCFIWNTK